MCNSIVSVCCISLKSKSTVEQLKDEAIKGPATSEDILKTSKTIKQM